MASYPVTIASFVNKTDNVDKVVANDVNILYEEVTALEGALGVGISNSDWSAGTFSSTTTSWSSLQARLRNIELGVKAAYSLVTFDGATAYIDGGTP